MMSERDLERNVVTATILDRAQVEIANVILNIVDDEKLFVVHDDITWDVEELRMQLREVAFAIIQGKEVKASMLS